MTTGKALLAVGGFSGRDESPTLAQFQQYVADHQIGYYLVRQRQNDNGQNSPQSGQPNNPQPGHNPRSPQQGDNPQQEPGGNPQQSGGPNNSAPSPLRRELLPG